MNAHGSWGELFPIVAISLLISARTTWVTLAVLLAFALLAVAVALISKKAKDKDMALSRFIIKNSETNSQMNIRAVVLLLVTLVTVSALFELDIVLGAFASGFILRTVLPHGDAVLEQKLNGIGYGFFVPLFFVVSGMKIDPAAVASEPVLVAAFILLLVLIRAVPIYVSWSISKESRDMKPRSKASVASYCTTALPLIVAVTSVATSMGVISQEIASILITAGGNTVLIMPLVASIVLHSLDADLVEAAGEIRSNPKEAYAILREHRKLERERSRVNERVFIRRGK